MGSGEEGGKLRFFDVDGAVGGDRFGVEGFIEDGVAGFAKGVGGDERNAKNE